MALPAKPTYGTASVATAIATAAIAAAAIAVTTSLTTASLATPFAATLSSAATFAATRISTGPTRDHAEHRDRRCGHPFTACSARHCELRQARTPPRRCYVLVLLIIIIA